MFQLQNANEKELQLKIQWISIYTGSLDRLQKLIADHRETDPNYENKEDLSNTALHVAATRGSNF